MPRTPSGLVSRLNDVLNTVVDLYIRRGYVSSFEVADVTDLSERAVRDYLNFLEAVGVLEYRGAGVYVVNEERVSEVLRFMELGSRTQLKITDFLDKRFFEDIRVSKRLHSKIRRILESLNLSLYFDGYKLRDRLADLRPGYTSDVKSDRFIYKGVARRFIVDNLIVPSSASSYLVRDYAFVSFVGTTNIYFSSAVFGAYYRADQIVDEKSVRRVIPDLTTYSGIEPLEYGDPFIEATTDLSDLIGQARKIAARFLSERLHLKLIIWYLKEYGDEVDVFFRYGDLFPHGFIIRARRLELLRREVFNLFRDLINLAKKKNVLIVGVSYRVSDNIFLRNVERALNEKISGANDDNFLNLILQDGDTTGLIYRKVEKGREPIENWYEFFLGFQKYCYRLSFISLEDPFEEYEKIRDLAYSTTTPPPTSDIPPAPSPIHTALIESTQKVANIERTVSAIMKVAFEEELLRIQKS